MKILAKDMKIGQILEVESRVEHIVLGKKGYSNERKGAYRKRLAVVAGFKLRKNRQLKPIFYMRRRNLGIDQWKIVEQTWGYGHYEEGYTVDRISNRNKTAIKISEVLIKAHAEAKLPSLINTFVLLYGLSKTEPLAGSIIGYAYLLQILNGCPCQIKLDLYSTTLRSIKLQMDFKYIRNPKDTGQYYFYESLVHSFDIYSPIFQKKLEKFMTITTNELLNI